MNQLQILTSHASDRHSVAVSHDGLAGVTGFSTPIRSHIDVSKIPSQSWKICDQNIFGLLSSMKPMQISPSASDAKVNRGTPSLEIKLFDNAAELKVALSHIVMHLAPEWRTAIFNQIDTLLNPNYWEGDSAFIKKSSFTTFLRFIIFAKSNLLPSLGVDFTGNLLAAWSNQEKSAVVEFFGNDQASATFVKQGAFSGEKETLAWQGKIEDLKHFIEQNGMMGCLQDNQS